MKLRQTKIYDIVAIILALFTVVCRLSTKVADMYAVYVYPRVSAVLSWLSSFVSFGVQEIIIALITAYAIYVTIKGIRYHYGWERIICSLMRVLVWTYIWFYLAWCINYSRSAIYQRTSDKITPYNEAVFKQFVSTFISESNSCYIKVVSCDKTQITKEIKEYYSSVPSILYFKSTVYVLHHLGSNRNIPFVIPCIHRSAFSVSWLRYCRNRTSIATFLMLTIPLHTHTNSRICLVSAMRQKQIGGHSMHVHHQAMLLSVIVHIKAYFLMSSITPACLSAKRSTRRFLQV